LKFIREALLNWINSRPVDSNDDYALVSGQETLAYRVAKTTSFSPFLENFKPDFSHQVAGSYGLSKALDMAADVNPRPNMQRVMLYITPLPANNELSALSEMTSRAVQLNVHVFVWLVTYTNYANDKGALALQDLAARTGGQYFLFSGPEKLPDIESYFSPLRGLYNVSYTSVINTSGTHTLSAVVSTTSGDITSAPQTFDLTVSAPIHFPLTALADRTRLAK